MNLTVLHAPLHAPSANRNPAGVIRAVRGIEPDLVGFSEAYAILPELQALADFRLIVENGGADRRRGQKDNPILARRGLTSHGSGQVWGCAPSTPLKYAPERWFTYSVTALGRGAPLFLLTLHPHPMVQDKDTGGFLDNDRAKEFAAMMRRFDDLLRWADAMGWRVVVVGDMNFRDRGDAPLSPYTIMRKHGLSVKSRGLDAVGFSPELRMDVREVPAPAGVTNHPWLLATSKSG